MDTCHWVRPKRLGDDAARGAPPAKQAKDIKRDTCHRDEPMRPGNDAALGRSQLNELGKMSPGSVDEGELG